jgi:hypothetical protein
MTKMKTIWKSIVAWFKKYGDFNPLLKSRIVLYFLFFISLANLYTFVSTGNTIYAAVFVIMGFLTSFFSKNMVVIMMIALAVSNVLLYGKQIGNVSEGFDAMSADDDDTTSVDEEKAESSLQKLIGSSSKAIPDSKESVDNTKLSTSIKDVKAKKPQPTEAQVEKTKADLKGLLELEVKLMQGVTEMQPLLEKAKDTILQLKQNIDA